MFSVLSRADRRHPLRRTVPALLAGLAIPLLAAACGSSTSTGGASSALGSAPSPTASPDPYNPVYGLDVGVQQGPDPDTPVSDAHIQQLLTTLQGRTTWVRFVGTTGQAKDGPKLAHQMGYKVAMVAFLTADTTFNTKEVTALEDDVRAGDVDLAVVGSEAIHDHYLTNQQLITYIKQFKSDTGGKVPVTTVEPDKEMAQNLSLIDAEDVVTVNIPPISYGIPIDKTLAYIQSTYATLVAAAKGKEVQIGETEWPSDGFPGFSSAENAAKYFNTVETWARQNNVKVFYFEAFDEPYLGHYNAIGPHWGIYTSDMQLKPGMETVFAK